MEQKTVKSLAKKLESFWDVLEKDGIDKKTVLKYSQLTPATYSIVGPKNIETVHKAYEYLNELKEYILSEYDLAI